MKIQLCFLLLLQIALGYGATAQSGNLIIKSNPPGAKIFINGEDSRAITPHQQSMLPGVYKFSFQLNDYREYSGQFTISANSTEEQNIDLKPGFGSLKITSNPDGAECILDDERKGTTPLIINNVQSGKHKLEINKSGYGNLVEYIIVEDEKTFEKTYNLSASFGSIGILGNPDADIYIDGKQIGIRKFSGPLEAGQHKLEIRKNHYISEIRTITIERDQQYPFINITLKPKYGSLSIKCDPAGATITLDDELKGKTPLILNNIFEGEHTLKIAKEEYRPYEKRIIITQDQTYSVDTLLAMGVAIHIGSDPDGGILKIDGESKGVLPLEMLLKKGQHNIEITKKGYDIFTKSINIFEDKEYIFELTRLNFNLEVSSSPSGASLTVNNIEIGKTPLKTSLNFGSNDFTLLLNGFKPISKKIEVTDPLQKLNFKLEPLTVRTRGKAIFYSLLFPGAGQSYLSRSGTPVLLGVVTYGCIAGGVLMNSKAVTSYNNYLAENNDPTKRASLEDDWTKQKQLTEILFLGGAALWTANLIWVVLMPDDKNRFNNINIQSFFDPKGKSSGLKLALNF